MRWTRRISHLRTIVARLLCGALVATSVAAATSAPLAAESRIVDVTVYVDRAEVVREATVVLTPGLNAVEFGNLPIRIDPDTLRVSAEGVPATLGAIRVRETADKPEETPEWIAAQLDVRRIQSKISEIAQEKAVDSDLRAFLKSVSNVTAANQARDLGEGRADPAVIDTVYSTLETRLGSLAGRKLDRQERKRALDEELEVAKAKLETLRPSGAIRSRTAVVEVEAQRAGRLTLQLAYLTGGASWRPSYRATLDAATGDVAMVAEGIIRQNSGEDWNDVTMRLSSASPAVGVQPPMLYPWILQPAAVAGGNRNPNSIEEMNVVHGGATASPVPERFYQNVTDLAPGVHDRVSADRAQSTLVRSAYNVAFGVPGTADVPADGNDHRVVLRRETLAANVVHRTVPGLSDRAYLTAVTTSPADYPLLAGPVRVFADSAYLGSFPLDETGPGIELTLPFGVDNRIEIIRVPEPEMKSRGGITGKYRVVERTHRTQIQNLLGREATLVIEERLPVATDSRIEIELGKSTTPGFQDSPRRPGVKIWTLNLAKGEQRELRFDYSVKYPKELVLPGL